MSSAPFSPSPWSLSAFITIPLSSTRSSKPPRSGVFFLKVTIGIWVASAVGYLPTVQMLQYASMPKMNGSVVKVCRLSLGEIWQKAYVVAMFSVFVLIPCVLIGVFYILAFRRLRADPESEDGNHDDGFVRRYDARRIQWMRMRKDMIRMLPAVVGMFVVCRIPYSMFGIWVTFKDHLDFGILSHSGFNVLAHVCRLIAFANHALNPVLYIFSLPAFLAKLRFACRRRRENVQRSYPMMSGLGNEREDMGAMAVPGEESDSAPGGTDRLSVTLEMRDVGQERLEEQQLWRRRQFMNDFLYAYTDA